MSISKEYEVVVMNENEQNLCKRLYEYLQGSPEQQEKGLEFMSESLEKKLFTDFLLKIKPTLFTECLYSTDFDVITDRKSVV